MSVCFNNSQIYKRFLYFSRFLPTILAGPDPTNIDYIMSAFNPYAHLQNDLFENKVAFITILNFPNFSLEEKNTLGKNWSRLEWAYARLGDMFTSRTDANLNKELAQNDANANNYESCVITAQNALKDYPYCIQREEFAILILRAKYQMAMKSIDEKKRERLRDALDEYYAFKNDYPESQYMEEADQMLKKINRQTGDQVLED